MHYSSLNCSRYYRQKKCVCSSTFLHLGLLVFNVTSYEYYSSSDAVSVMTEKRIITFLERIAAGDVPPLGGRSLSQRIKRLCFEVSSCPNFMTHFSTTSFQLFKIR